MKITVLVENTSRRDDIVARHGLSLYIEARGRRILFDMGQDELFYENAVRLGIDLSAVDIAIISHGHYDHGGGLAKFIEINDTAPIYIHKAAFLPYYNGNRYIGLDPALRESRRITLVDGDISIGGGLYLRGLDTPPTAPTQLGRMVDGRIIPDAFDHEMYLMIEGEKRVIVSGCSHKGIEAIAERFRPDVLIGGLHLMDMPADDRLAALGRRLDASGCEYYTCHCTGYTQYEFLAKYIKRISYLSSGDEIAID